MTATQHRKESTMTGFDALLIAGIAAWIATVGTMIIAPIYMIITGK